MSQNFRLFLLLAKRDSKTIESHIRQMLSFAKKACYHCGLDTETAKDIALRSVQRLIEDIENGRFVYWEKPPIVWAKAIARNFVLEAIKDKTKKWNFSPIEDFNENIPEYEDVKQKNDREMIEIMLACLTHNERLLVRLHYLMGYSYKQIMTYKLTHYTSEASIKVLCKRAIDKLKGKFPDRNSFDHFDFPTL